MIVHERDLVLLVSDLAGFAKWAGTESPTRVAEVLHEHYCRCVAEVVGRGGTIIKYMGDACLAVFPGEGSDVAVECARALAAPHPEPRLQAGIRVHRARVAIGTMGPPEHCPVDVLGAGVNALFLMPSCLGVRLSQAVFDALPPAAQAQWRPDARPVTYLPA